MGERVVRPQWKRRSIWSADVLAAGAASGLVGGTLMMAFAAGHAALAGAGFAYPVKLVAATFVGAGALVGGAGVLTLGLALHLVLSLLLGLGFALAMERRGGAASVPVAALLFGLGLLLVMTFLVLPLANPMMQTRMLAAPGAWLVMHALYGTGLFLVPLVRRRMAARDDRGAEIIPLPLRRVRLAR